MIQTVGEYWRMMVNDDWHCSFFNRREGKPKSVVENYYYYFLFYCLLDKRRRMVAQYIVTTTSDDFFLADAGVTLF
jgi:hypothetical protein